MAAGVLEDALQAQLMSYAGISEIESIASSCRSMSMNDRGSDSSLHDPHISESPSMSPTRQPSLGPEGPRTAGPILPSSEGSFALRHGLSESMAMPPKLHAGDCMSANPGVQDLPYRVSTVQQPEQLYTFKRTRGGAAEDLLPLQW